MYVNFSVTLFHDLETSHGHITVPNCFSVVIFTKNIIYSIKIIKLKYHYLRLYL